MKVKVYGTQGDNPRMLQRLSNAGVDYEYINVARSAAASLWIRELTGRQATPTIEFDGHVLVRPTERQLESAIRELVH